MVYQEDAQIFDEVQEALEEEKTRKMWLKYRPYVIAFFVVFFASLFAKVGWQNYQQGKDREASDLFFTAMEAMEKKDTATASKQFTTLFETQPDHGYSKLARLMQARLSAQGGDKSAALSHMEILAQDTNDSGTNRAIHNLALLNAARLTASDPTRAKGFLENIDADSPFQVQAQEMLGLMALKMGDRKGALLHFTDALGRNPGGELQARLTHQMERLGGEQKKPVASRIITPATDPTATTDNETETPSSKQDADPKQTDNSKKIVETTQDGSEQNAAPKQTDDSKKIVETTQDGSEAAKPEETKPTQ
ncbi:MAG: tetratricopeptide repeat protein [Magnetococcales bacterium]|nr:tetratricopeptide repeat protein [Magnetococcales bacterium]